MAKSTPSSIHARPGYAFAQKNIVTKKWNQNSQQLQKKVLKNLSLSEANFKISKHRPKTLISHLNLYV